MTLYAQCLSSPDITFLLSRWDEVCNRKTEYILCIPMPLNHKERRKIKKIELVQCSFRDANAVHLLVKFMQVMGEDLEALYIQDGGGGFGPHILGHLDESLLTIIFTGIQKLQHLKRLYLSYMDLKVVHLKDMMEKSTNIQSLDLCGCQLDDSTFMEFLKGLQSHRSGLQYLEICDEILCDTRLQLLVDGLIGSKTQTSLKHLAINDNPITHRSFESLSKILSQFHNLRKLNVRYCAHLFDDVEQEKNNYLAFTQALKSNDTLHNLNLCWCVINDQLAVPLFSALEENSSLKVLDVRAPRRMGALHSASHSIPKMKGLQRLYANLPYGSPELQNELHQNTSLTSVFNEFGICPGDKLVRHILRRNQMLQKIVSLLNSRIRLNAGAWAYCIERVMREASGDMTTVYAFMVNFSGELTPYS
eukprot:CAMPEP_0198141106 /NCGR_PEP_ID=MMETSP1443-20131203/4174_1 /TAXON_ID=186043 /ORGANISM="Entomoneis sp., Strain CCMP2396" /LENGTH=418 /DNA_ID=CAMNT_0043803745 /DNA_START=120 /DNA_END=1376 /DNA_ORIENTATION=+